LVWGLNDLLGVVHMILLSLIPLSLIPFSGTNISVPSSRLPRWNYDVYSCCIISACKICTFQSYNTNNIAILVFLFTYALLMYMIVMLYLCFTYVHMYLEFHLRQDIKLLVDGCENFWVEIHTPKNEKNIIIGIIYRHAPTLKTNVQTPMVLNLINHRKLPINSISSSEILVLNLQKKYLLLIKTFESFLLLMKWILW
jgi:hypothetical protein